MMHEFGHGAGLEDTDTLDQDVYGNCVTSYSPDNIKDIPFEVTECDERQLNQTQRLGATE